MGEETRENQAGNVMDIARAVSHSQEVIDGLSVDRRTTKIQAYTAVVQEDTNVDYIVVMDNDHIRRSHPVEEKIGQYFVGNDEDRAFQGKQYTSVAEGTLGESMRAFMPIWNENEQVGVVAVGILLDKVEDAVFARRYCVYRWKAAGCW